MIRQLPNDYERAEENGKAKEEEKKMNPQVIRNILQFSRTFKVEKTRNSGNIFYLAN